MNLFAVVREDPIVTQTVREMALEGYEGPGKTQFESREKYRWLKKTGSRLWLDTGDIEAAEEVWGAELEALTTNNTHVNQVVATGAMDGLITYACRRIRDVRPDISAVELVAEIGFLVNAKIALGLVQKFGAHVSVELHPALGFDVAKTLTYARRYYEINPDFFYIKVPLTPDGFIAVRQLSNEGIPVNFTLGFSARQNYLATRFSKPRFVNVFLGRLNSLVEENHLGNPENVGEKAALASYEAVKSLREAHADTATQQIAASMRSGGQVVTLAGVDVLTMPPKVAGEYLALDISESSIQPVSSEELHVNLGTAGPVMAGELLKLWEVDTDFIAFTEDAVCQADQMSSGRDLVELSSEHRVGLFRHWTDDDRHKIRQKGKIPKVSDWPGTPLDDMMSIAALETFAKDQLELDERIIGLIKQA